MLRNLAGFMVVLLVFTLASTAQELDDAGFVPIFTGQDLAGWHEMGQQDWHADDGILWTEGKGGWLRSDQPYTDFALRLEYRLTKGAVTGIFLRSAEQGDPTFTGLKISLLDDAGQLTDLHSTGAIYGAVIPLYSVGRKAGEWNQVEISCIGRHLTVYLNGNRIHKIDFDDPAFVFSEKRPLSRVPNQGYIGLESHTNRVDFRSLRLQVIKPSA
jgi:3-keto-disaccharide hydrolase